MIIPFEGRTVRLTSPYGERELEGTSGFHGGVDLVGLDSWNVISVVPGIVAASELVTDRNNPNWMWGNYVTVLGDDGLLYFHFHLQSRAVERYERVERGTLLGVMGNTGYSFGAHLHFEVRESDGATRRNAAEYLGIPNVEGVYTAGEGMEDSEMTQEKFEEMYGVMTAKKTGDAHASWATQFVDWAIGAGLFVSDGEGNYRWSAPVTREELATVLYRFGNYIGREN